MELLIEDAVIVTMGPGGGTAGAMLVRDGRIAVVGDPEQVRAAASPGAAVARLGGATVIPGLIDAHCHVSTPATSRRAPTAAAGRARHRRHHGPAARASGRPTARVTGSGYAEYQLTEGRGPTRQELDAAVPDRPGVLYHTSLHACVLNSPAARGRVPDRSPTPRAARSAATATAASTGWCRGACSRCSGATCGSHLPDGAAGRARLMERAGQHLAALGITAACDADLRRDRSPFAAADRPASCPADLRPGHAPPGGLAAPRGYAGPASDRLPPRR